MKIVVSMEFDSIQEFNSQFGSIAKKKTAPAAEDKEQEEEPDLLGGETDEIPEGATIEQIRALVTQKTKKEKKTDAVVKLLTKYKAENVTLLDKKHYQAFFDALGKL